MDGSASHRCLRRVCVAFPTKLPQLDTAEMRDLLMKPGFFSGGPMLRSCDREEQRRMNLSPGRKLHSG